MNSMKKRVILIGSFSPPIGGVTRHLDQLYSKMISNGIMVEAIRINKPLNLFKLVSLRFKYSVVHFHTSNSLFKSFFLVLLLKLLGYKVIISIHHGGIINDINKNKISLFLTKSLLKVAERLVLMNRKHVNELNVCIPGYKRKIEAISPFVFPESNPGTYVFQPNKQTVKITVMGLWQELYNFESVIECLNQITENKISVLFELDLIVSTSFENLDYKSKVNNIIQRINKYNLKINITENINNSYEYFKDRHIFIRPTKIDSFGLSVAEALFCGIPVIASNVCDRPAAVLLYDPENMQILKKLILKLVDEGLSELQNKQLIDFESDGYFQLIRMYEGLNSKKLS